MQNKRKALRQQKSIIEYTSEKHLKSIWQVLQITRKAFKTHRKRIEQTSETH